VIEPIVDESIDLELTRCPLEYITDDVIEVIEYAELYEKGIPPVSGGALDQAKVFTDCCRMIFAEQSYWKRKFKLV